MAVALGKAWKGRKKAILEAAEGSTATSSSTKAKASAPAPKPPSPQLPESVPAPASPVAVAVAADSKAGSKVKRTANMDEWDDEEDEEKEEEAPAAKSQVQSQSKASVAVGGRAAPVLRDVTPEEAAIADQIDDLDTALENAHIFMSKQDSEGIFATPVGTRITSLICLHITQTTSPAHRLTSFPTCGAVEQVSDLIAPGYSQTIKAPMDLNTMQSLLARYTSLADFEKDLKRMFANCIAYNEPKKSFFYSNVRH
jgi:hypothetical protein